ncbi:MAG: trypsin-like peptidase domain-containing protein [Oscillospiraceae bacterium]|nr:trypsin-like peptidase domain-containing protein [Oscillospiraceae bacterium]
MKKIKRVLSGFIATATLLTGTAFPVSATTYDQCDLNKDGYVGVADAAIFNKYLAGSYYVPNYNILDFNKSLTVDAADAEYIYAKLYGTSYEACYWSRANENDNNKDTYPNVDFPAVSGFTPDAYASNTAGREYRRYSYTQKKELAPYTLTPTLGDLNSVANSRGVIGVDDRYRANGTECTGIVRLVTTCNGVNYLGTGFIVGDHQIVTNAHCVYKDNLWPSDIKINLYNESGQMTNKELHWVEAHIPSNYTNGSVIYDYALITVKEDLSEYNCVYFSIGNSYNLTTNDYASVPLYLTGCPGTVHGISNKNPDNINDNNIFYLYSAEGRILSSNYSYMLSCNIDASNGQSGSPIYTITQNKVGNSTYYTYTALGIYKGGKKDGISNEYIYNGGPLITKYHLQFYNNNPNASYIVD